jgi:hypothetical protein
MQIFALIVLVIIVYVALCIFAACAEHQGNNQ